MDRRHAYIYIIYAACKFLSRNYATHGSPFTIGDERNAVVVAKKKRLDSNREREREREREHGFEGEDKGLITLSIDVNLN